MSTIVIERIRRMMEDPPVKWLKNAGQYFDILEEGHVKVIVANELHLNHVNIIYAGSIFTFAEMSGGALFLSTYGFDQWLPILKKAEIRYMKPITGDFIIDIKLTEEEKKSKIQPIADRGRGEFLLSIPVIDTEGNIAAECEFTYYILPANKTEIAANTRE